MFRLNIYTGLFCILVPIFLVAGDKQCDPSDLTNPFCSSTEVCDKETNSCQCLPGYKRQNDTSCLPIVSSSTEPDSSSSYSSLVDNKGSGSIVAGILIPIFLVMFVICGVYFNKKYHILMWVRNKITRRNENYDEFMIGQDVDDDDPPLH